VPGNYWGSELGESYEFSCGRRLRDRDPVFSEAPDMHFNRLVHSAGGLIAGLASRDATG